MISRFYRVFLCYHASVHQTVNDPCVLSRVFQHLRRHQECRSQHPHIGSPHGRNANANHLQGDFALEQDSPKLNYAGFGILSPLLFEGCKRGIFGIYSILAKARSEHQISAEHYQGTWFNVGTPEILQEVEILCAGIH